MIASNPCVNADGSRADGQVLHHDVLAEGEQDGQGYSERIGLHGVGAGARRHPQRRCARGPGDTTWVAVGAAQPPPHEVRKSPKKVIKNWNARAQRLAELTVDGAVHILRHAFCSHLAMRGARARAIQELAGHVDLKTTQRYMHLSPAAVESAIRLLETGRADTATGGDLLETTFLGGRN